MIDARWLRVESLIDEENFLPNFQWNDLNSTQVTPSPHLYLAKLIESSLGA
jgi:hypothetical protein